MDLDLDGADPSPAPARQSRFKPKPARNTPKPSPAANSDSLPPPPPPAKDENPIKEKELEEEKPIVNNGENEEEDDPMERDADDDGKNEEEDDPMERDDDDDFGADDDEEGGEDEIVRELDIHMSSSLGDGASLYVMQYLPRPSWRPYELNERCEEVRLKPQQSIFEVDLSTDNDNEDYDHEMTESSNLRKRMLSSAVAPPTNDFAIGIIVGNQLHLTPVHAIVQLRPPMTCLQTGAQKRKHNAQSLEAITNLKEESLGGSVKASVGQQGKPALKDSSENLNDDEPWVSLKYHQIESPLSGGYKNKMMEKKDNHVNFVVQKSDYFSFLCPGTSTNSKKATGISIRNLLSMSLEDRLRKWLCEGRQVNCFAALLHLDPTNNSVKDDLLRMLPHYAYLVQGLWVSKSSLLYKGFEALVGDYISFLFSKNYVVHYDKKKQGTPNLLKLFLSLLAVQRPHFNDWKFKEATDISFIKAYPHIVKEQECAWSSREKELLDSLRGAVKSRPENLAMDYLINALNPHLRKKETSSGKADPDPKKDTNKIMNSIGTTVSSETQDLLKVLSEIFSIRSVRSLNSIQQALHGSGINPPPELIPVLGQIAENVHGVYISNSSGNSDLDPVRKAVIKLILDSEPNTKLKKDKIESAVKSSVKRTVSASEYRKVVTDLCINKDGWVLKNGEE